MEGEKERARCTTVRARAHSCGASLLVALPGAVTSKVSTGASKSLYQTRPRTVAFSNKTSWVVASVRFSRTSPADAAPPEKMILGESGVGQGLEI